jgi:heme exporter protein D
MGSASAVSVYFELGTTANYGTVTAKQTVTTAGPFSIEITGLDPNTTYHFRAVVDGGEHGKTFSADNSFTTTKTSYMLFIWLAAGLGVLIVAGIVIYVIRNKRGYPRIKRKPAVRPYIETLSDEDLIPEEEKSANIGIYPESKPETDARVEETASQAPAEEEVTPGEKIETEDKIKSDDDEKPDEGSNPHDDLPLIK